MAEANKIYQLTDDEMNPIYPLTDVHGLADEGQPISFDDKPTSGSTGIVKSGGVFDEIVTNGSAFDLTEYMSGATYSDITVALSTMNSNVPSEYKRGGMMLKYVDSTDNKYVHWFNAYSAWTTTVTYWQGVDVEPTAGSKNLVESGGVASEIVWDVTARNSNATFESLSALLNDANLATLIPTTIRRGGMQIRFVLTSDNKYVQYRLISPTWSITESDWQGVDDEPTAGSDNLVESGGVFAKLYGKAYKGSEIPDSSWINVITFDLIQGKKYKITFNLSQPYSSDLYYKIVDSEDNVIRNTSVAVVHPALNNTINFTPSANYNGAKILLYLYTTTDNPCIVTVNEEGGIQKDIEDLGKVSVKTISQELTNEQKETVLNNLGIVIDASPTPDSNNFAGSGGVYNSINERVLDGTAKLGFVGANNDYVTGIPVYGIKPNTVYEVIVNNPDYEKDGITITSDVSLFEVKCYNNSDTLLNYPVQVTWNQTYKAIQSKYIISTPQNTTYIRVGGRANSGVYVDCEIREVQKSITDNITSYKDLLDYGHSLIGKKYKTSGGTRVRCICKINKGTPIKLANTKYALYATLYPSIESAWNSGSTDYLEFYTGNAYTQSCEAISNYAGYLVFGFKNDSNTDISDEEMADMLDNAFVYIGEESVKLIDIKHISDCEVNRCNTGSSTTSLTGTRLRCLIKVYNGESLYVSCTQGKGVAATVYEDAIGAMYAGDAYKVLQIIQYSYSSEIKNKTINYDGYLSLSLSKNDGSTFTDAEVQQFIAATQLVIVKTYQSIEDKLEFEQLASSKSILALNNDMEGSISSMCDAYQNKANFYYQPDWNKGFFSFSVISDIHATHDSIRRFIEYTNKHKDYLDYGVCLGDIVQVQPSEGSKWFEDSISECEIPMLFTVGNHDTADTGLSGISEAQARERYFSAIETNEWIPSDNFIDDDRCSWYLDNTTYKIRVISLFEYQNSMSVVNGATWDYCRRWLDSDTLQWFADTLYSTPSDYAVLVMLHQSPTYAFSFVDNLFTIPDGYKTFTTNTVLNTIDGNPITDIVDAFINGTAIQQTYNQIQDYGSKTATVDRDFSSRGEGEFICYVTGHVHGNYIITPTAYPSQKIICVPSGSQSSYQRKYGDINADPNNRSIDDFYCIGIDTTHKRINIVQIGGQVSINMTKRDFISIAY